jgi:Leucine-rich repeat (LRR) protein
LEQNKIESLPLEIAQLVNLEMLSLCRNQIESLPSGIGQLVNLQYLYLRYNQIKSLPPEVGQLTKLKTLLLSTNKIESLPSEIANLVNLKEFSLIRNQIVNIPLEITKLKEVIYMDETSYNINNLDLDCKCLIFKYLKNPIDNLPICLEELWLSYPIISINQLKIPFGCKVYVNNILQN